MKRLLPTLLGLCCIADASAQLKVQSVLPHGAAPEKTAPAVYDSTANIRTGGDAAYYESLVGQRILFYPRDIHADLRPVAYFNFLAETPAVVRIDTVWLRKPRRKVRPEDFRIDTLYSDTYRPRFYKDETTAACGCTTMESHVLGRDLFPTAPETGWFTPAEAIEGKTFEITGLKTHRIQGEAFRVFRLRSKEGETLYWYAHAGKDKTNLRDEYYPVVVEGLIEKYRAAYVGREFFLTKRKPEAPGYVSGYFGLQAKTMQGEENRLNFGTELKCLDLRLIGDGTGYAVPAFVFERKEDSVRIYDDAQILDLLRRTQELEKQKGILYGLILIVLGIACSALSATTDGSEAQDFVSGLLMGLSIVEMLTGIAVIGKKLLRG